VLVRLLTVVDVREDDTDARRMSLSARHEAVLADGRRVVLLDDRGWSEEIRAAGGDNIAGDSVQPYPQFSVERMLARAPDVIVVGSHKGGPSPAPLTAHTSLPAVKNGRVHSVDGDFLFRPGPRVVDGIELLARLFHP